MCASIFLLCAIFVAGAGAAGETESVRTRKSAAQAQKQALSMINALLERLGTALVKHDANQYAACFASAYLQKRYGAAEGREVRIREFLRKQKLGRCSFEEVKASPMEKRPKVFRVSCYRCVLLSPNKAPKKPSSGSITGVESEYFKDVMVVSLENPRKPVIEWLESKVSPERKRAVYQQYLKEEDRNLVELVKDGNKEEVPFALAMKAHYLQVLGRLKEAEACLRRAARMAGPGSTADLALANFLRDQSRHSEALPLLRRAAAQLKKSDPERRDVLRWVKECEEAIRVRSKKGTRGEVK